jgi:hypothetical protein
MIVLTNVIFCKIIKYSKQNVEMFANLLLKINESSLSKTCIFLFLDEQKPATEKNFQSAQARPIFGSEGLQR